MKPWALGKKSGSFAWAVLGGILFLGGCAGSYVIPDSLAGDLDRSVSFASLLADPESRTGEMIALGGVVLGARNLKEGTEIEVLQLPLDRYDRPMGPLTNSEGRFLVLHPGYLETAVLRNGQRITVVGEITGKKVRTLDEIEYAYPYLNARFFHIWPEQRAYRAYPYPYPYPSLPYPYGPYPYWPRYYPYYGYDPWGPPVIIVPKDSPPPKRRFDPAGGGPSSSPAPSSPPKGSNRQIR